MCCWHCFHLSFPSHHSPLHPSATGNAAETGLALLLLFVFALFASGYVLKEGLRKKEKTTHELLLKCVIIITSVVPRQLPMQVKLRFVFLWKGPLFAPWGASF
jgi:hypothetical protein